MAIELPSIITNYFAADKVGDPEAASRLFAESAVVTDQRKRHAGRDAIARWMAEASSKYTYTVEPFAMAVAGRRIIVTSHLVGDFPGSPLDLRYAFVLEGDEIAELEIAL